LAPLLVWMGVGYSVEVNEEGRKFLFVEERRGGREGGRGGGGGGGGGGEGHVDI